MSTLIERINELEKENKNILTRLTECESRISGIESRQSLAENRLNNTEAKINQIIDEIQPILTSHANALKELLANLKVRPVKV